MHFATGHERHANTAIAHLESAVDLLLNNTVDVGLHYGFAGVAWVLHHLTGALLEDDSDLTGDSDIRVLQAVERAPWQGRFDLTSGLVGFGLLGMESTRAQIGRRIVEAVADRLVELAEESEQGLAWPTPPHHIPPERRLPSTENYVNLGIAHGQCGVIAFLASAAKVSDSARHALPAAVRWLAAQRLREPAIALFPPEVVEGQPPMPSRLAWCYGDIGVCFALRRAARALADPAMSALALEIGLHTTRRDPATTWIGDAGLCHGSAGVALMFARLWHETGDEHFARAARYWAARTMTFAQAKSDTGFTYPEMQPTSKAVVQTPGLGLLSGATGTALGLLALVSDCEPRWDRALLLS
jgi:lantibiotic modifying enzyme